jgi:uncharacterized membrane protein YhaH (DUF805 family)
MSDLMPQIEQITKLMQLLQQGAISQAEFDDLKKQVLSGEPATVTRPHTDDGARIGYGERRGVSFVDAISLGFSKYATGTGRAPRSEYWYWVLFLVVAAMATSVLDRVLGFTSRKLIELISVLFFLATLIPSIAVTTRRLHDTNRSGWWQLLYFIPIIGGIVVLFWTCTRGDAGANDYGDDPLDNAATRAAPLPSSNDLSLTPNQGEAELNSKHDGLTSDNSILHPPNTQPRSGNIEHEHRTASLLKETASLSLELSKELGEWGIVFAKGSFFVGSHSVSDPYEAIEYARDQARQVMSRAKLEVLIRCLEENHWNSLRLEKKSGKWIFLLTRTDGTARKRTLNQDEIPGHIILNVPPSRIREQFDIIYA